MADFAIEQGMAEDDYRYDHPEEFEDENCDMPPNPNRLNRSCSDKICKRCKKEHLRWGFSKKHCKWLLYDTNGNLHTCKPNIKCNMCGQDGFYWRKTGKGDWRLFSVNKNTVHNCNKKFAKGGKRIIYK